MGLDWADGDYDLTAATLEPAAASLVQYAGVTAAHHVLDVGCGTGNATVIAARLGARVTAVDPAEGLIEIARDKVATIDADVTFHEGTADALPVADGACDITLSAFAVIFAEEPAAAIAEMARATRPGGTVAFTTWRTDSVICAIGNAFGRRIPDEQRPQHRRWGEDDWVRELLHDAGLVDVEIAEAVVEFRGGSPEEFLAELEQHHPAWRAARRQLSPDEFAAAHDEALGILHAENQRSDGFFSESAYALIRGRRPS
jgi:ubiquinone/menaquinone biosynthesis C-methylase UbiE